MYTVIKSLNLTRSGPWAYCSLWTSHITSGYLHTTVHMNMLFSFEDFTYTDNRLKNKKQQCITGTSTSAMVLNFKENMILMHMGSVCFFWIPEFRKNVLLNIKLIKSDRFVQGCTNYFSNDCEKKCVEKILSIATVFNIDNKKWLLSGKSA